MQISVQAGHGGTKTCLPGATKKRGEPRRCPRPGPHGQSLLEVRLGGELRRWHAAGAGWPLPFDAEVSGSDAYLP